MNRVELFFRRKQILKIPAIFAIFPDRTRKTVASQFSRPNPLERNASRIQSSLRNNRNPQITAKCESHKRLAKTQLFVLPLCIHLFQGIEIKSITNFEALNKHSFELRSREQGTKVIESNFCEVGPPGWDALGGEIGWKIENLHDHKKLGVSIYPMKRCARV